MESDSPNTESCIIVIVVGIQNAPTAAISIGILNARRITPFQFNKIHSHADDPCCSRVTQIHKFSDRFNFIYMEDKLDNKKKQKARVSSSSRRPKFRFDFYLMRAHTHGRTHARTEIKFIRLSRECFCFSCCCLFLFSFFFFSCLGLSSKSN